MMRVTTIGRAARIADVGVETIRFYERIGLIKQPGRPKDAGFRDYPDQTIQRIQFIRKAKELGFSLNEIKDLLSLQMDPHADCANVRQRAESKLAEMKTRVAGMIAMTAALETLIATCPGSGTLEKCSIIDGFGIDGFGSLPGPEAEAEPRGDRL